MILYTNKHLVPFQIDEADYEAVSRYMWHIGDGYVMTNIGKGKWPRQRPLSLHLFLLGRAPEGLEWDHIDRNKLNNRRSNLRAVPHRVNVRNVGVCSQQVWGIRGVVWRRKFRRWAAQVGFQGRIKGLGWHKDFDSACWARREWDRAHPLV